MFGHKRTLHIKLVTYNHDEIKIIHDVVQNMSDIVRDGVLSRYGNLVVDRARSNLAEFTDSLGGAGETGSTGALARSIMIVYNPNGDMVEIEYGSGLKYANIHDKPLGTFHTIIPTNKEYLIFPNRREGGIHKTKSPVQRPVSGYMERAVDYANHQVARLIREEVEFVKEDFARTPVQLTKKGGAVWRFGSISKAKALELGLVKYASSRRRDIVLTQAGIDRLNKKRKRK